mmetsp:Transcript_24747/g.43292  ORF Transcript_24747/g.43292 Transcript_24747/m.43292 type:complete len:269 (-) Transcript_24747:684-1490(-)
MYCKVASMHTKACAEFAKLFACDPIWSFRCSEGPLTRRGCGHGIENLPRLGFQRRPLACLQSLQKHLQTYNPKVAVRPQKLQFCVEGMLLEVMMVALMIVEIAVAAAAALRAMALIVMLGPRMMPHGTHRCPSKRLLRHCLRPLLSPRPPVLRRSLEPPPIAAAAKRRQAHAVLNMMTTTSFSTAAMAKTMRLPGKWALRCLRQFDHQRCPMWSSMSKRSVVLQPPNERRSVLQRSCLLRWNPKRRGTVRREVLHLGDLLGGRKSCEL